ncbi:hypothetical protein LT679_14345 [Mucilaginibacter roseus]|uniref:Uncharacterized protein n=1 Tax=Mucilaginibacter roseus TaxID=1528868 RepID=A0ABS8U678_9SPHI|nr:hypothetical protein [Mucilaginibacter roseus]MCD8741792.1 hypothetical protein [Mucilaginibacter roseus]
MEQLSALTTEELIKRKQRLKGILIGFITLAGMLIGVYAYMYFVKSKPMSPATFVPLIVLPITWLPMISSLSSINAELKLRNKVI